MTTQQHEGMTRRDFGMRMGFAGAVFGLGAVRSYRQITRERGGYILCGSQEFIEDIPLDNILAMYDENQKSIQPANAAYRR